MQLTQTWDKTFPKSDKVDHQKVTFKNRYGIMLVGDLYLPKNKGNQKLASIILSGPFGAVKEQASGLHAQTLADVVLSLWHLILLLQGKVAGMCVILHHQILIPKTLALR